MMTMMPQGRERGESKSEEKAHFEHSSLSLVQVKMVKKKLKSTSLDDDDDDNYYIDFANMTVGGVCATWQG